MKEKDFTPTGLKIEGAYENDRNQDVNQLLRDILEEVFMPKGANRFDVIIGHHLCYSVEDIRPDEGSFFVVEEIPSIDTLIFNHDIAIKLWGDKFKLNLTLLALEPCATRDKLLGELYYGRK